MTMPKTDVQLLTDTERTILKVLFIKGYRYITCDKDGIVYAYINASPRDVAIGIWYSINNCSPIVNKRLIPGFFDWIKYEDEPWFIPVLLE